MSYTHHSSFYFQACNAPLYKLLGGRSSLDFPVFYCVWPDSMEKMVEHTRQAKKDGYFMYQVNDVCAIFWSPEEIVPPKLLSC